MCISTVQARFCKAELPGKYSYFHEVLKKQALCMHATRFSDFKTTSSVITTYEKGLIIYGLSPTQQQAHKELLQDLQQYNYGLVTTQQQVHKELLQDLLSIYGLNRHT